jgi:hypothetical protein
MKKMELCDKVYNPYTYCPLKFEYEDDVILGYIISLVADIKLRPQHEAESIDECTNQITAYMNGRIAQILKNME